MFSNCLRYNTPESPIIEQARKLRVCFEQMFLVQTYLIVIFFLQEAFEYKIARIPDEWFNEKLVVNHHHTSNGSTTSPTVRFVTSASTSSSSPSLKHHDSHKSKKSHGESRKSSKGRSSVDNSGLALSLNQFNVINTPSTSSGSAGSRMEQLERQVANLTNALQACLAYGNNTGADQARHALMAAVSSLNSAAPVATTPTNGTMVPTRGRPRKSTNGYQNQQPKSSSKKKTTTPKKQTASKKRKHHLSSDEDSDSDDDIMGQVGGLAEPFDPTSIEDLKKLKNDLENLRGNLIIYFHSMWFRYD